MSETLADVKAGDIVTVFPGHVVNGYHDAPVDRVTKTQIVVEGHKYWRVNSTYGNRIGIEVARFSRAKIAIGAEAETKRVERDNENLRNQTRADWRQRTRADDLSREAVLEVRDACDRAEAALRKLGEWADDTAEARGDPS